jgi:hypothetical protein
MFRRFTGARVPKLTATLDSVLASLDAAEEEALELVKGLSIEQAK